MRLINKSERGRRDGSRGRGSRPAPLPSAIGEKLCVRPLLTLNYLTLPTNEIAIYSEDGKLKHLRIPGLSFHSDIIRPIAIEVEDQIYAPILDRQGNIITLINTKTKEIISYADLDLWGTNLETLSPVTPWIFGSKHYEHEASLIFFGHRYYDPELREWISPDPLGLQGESFYQYCLGNPIRYIDPDGRFAIAIPIAVFWGGVAISEVVIDAAIAVGASWIGYEIIKRANEDKIENEVLEQEKLDRQQIFDNTKYRNRLLSKLIGLAPNYKFQRLG